MAGDKYLYNNVGTITEKAAIQSSAGAGDAGKIPAVDSTGKLDTSFMPVGVSPETDSVVSSENLAAGDFVNLWNSTGLKVRKADATVAGKEAYGFVLASVTAPAAATVYRISQSNTQKVGMTVGAKQFLSTTPGLTTETAPAAAGNVVQMLGIAVSATVMNFSPNDPIVLA